MNNKEIEIIKEKINSALEKGQYIDITEAQINFVMNNKNTGVFTNEQLIAVAHEQICRNQLYLMI